MTTTVKFGLLYGGAGPWVTRQGARLFATEAEAVGFDSIWAVDHVLVSDNLEADYRSQGGSWDLSPDYPIADPMVWLSYVAAMTERIELATGVLVAPLRPAAVLANQAASLDVLSEGRFTLGLGAGWVRQELEACGVTFAQRMELLEESVQAMRSLWSGPRASFEGAHFTFDSMTLAPRPRHGSIPIVLGGRVPAAAVRAGRLGDGYFPHTSSRTDLRALFEIARDAAVTAGRDPEAMACVAGGARTVEDAQELAAMGVTHIVLSPRAREVSELRDRLQTLMGDLVEPFRKFENRNVANV